jgi:hypothetical protein
MKNLILYFALGLSPSSGYHSLEPCDSSCYDEPRRVPDKGLENVLGMAIRKEDFEVPESPNYKRDFSGNDGRRSLGKVNSGYNLGNNFRINIPTNSGKSSRVSQKSSKFSGAHNSKPLNLCERK